MSKTVKGFLMLALAMLVIGIFFGVIGGFQYLFPTWLKEWLPFTKTRPLHVSLVISWIFTAATAGIYYYLPRITGKPLFSEKLARWHLIILLFNTVAIFICYLLGLFGGREYLEFPPLLALPVIIYWALFMINYFMTIRRKLERIPIYIWMWTTGLIFFFITFCEAYLWLIPFFRDNIVRDVTVQWKAMGSMVGSWNMMVYGTGFYVMKKISGNDNVSRSPLTYFFYFLGLMNLLFNWGHHTYIVPAAKWIGTVAYIISMTELVLLGSIILNWRKSLNQARKHFHIISYHFLFAADIWIFLNLCLAICISIPSINYYTHGTHITVAHAMGATIGINTMILLASLYFIAESSTCRTHILLRHKKKIKVGFWITNISLLFFWLSLIGSGIVTAMEKEKGTAFSVMMLKLSTWFHAFAGAGVGIFAGVIVLSIPLFNNIYRNEVK